MIENNAPWGKPLLQRENSEREFVFTLADFERVRKLIYEHAGIAPLWPAYHLATIAQAMVGFGTERSLWPHLAFALAFAALFLFLARRRLARG